jgi:hypothetical protein
LGSRYTRADVEVYGGKATDIRNRGNDGAFLDNKRFLAFIVNDNSHFVLAVRDRERKEILYVDSLSMKDMGSNMIPSIKERIGTIHGEEFIIQQPWNVFYLWRIMLDWIIQDTLKMLLITYDYVEKWWNILINMWRIQES